MPVRIVTDSTASLPPYLAERHGIEVVPLLVRFGDTEYRDGVDLSDAEFYRMLEERPEHPVTSQPSPAAFADVYRRLGAAGDAIVSVHISSALSGTLASARLAAQGVTLTRAYVPLPQCTPAGTWHPKSCFQPAARRSRRRSRGRRRCRS
ncbi:MAG: DegV family EDD domain-containing protein [Actinobacteria bacterium]|nr:DegV family EDD domain-containing protein [Actinomycetota bacterium]